MVTRKTQGKKPTADKGRTKGITVEPVSLLHLMDSVGPHKAAELLGTVPQTLYRARTDGYVSKVYEVAAAGALREMAGDMAAVADKAQPTSRPAPAQRRVIAHTGQKTEIFIVEVNEDKVPTFEKFTEMVGGKLLRP